VQDAEIASGDRAKASSQPWLQGFVEAGNWSAGIQQEGQFLAALESDHHQ
jgi:hypothetical protein